MRVVLLTHVFPRAVNDPLGAFLLHLAQPLVAAREDDTTSRVQLLVLAPHAPGLEEREYIGDVAVQRFHYAPDAAETLAYTGIMHEQVARGVRARFAFARFFVAYTRAARAAVRAQRAQVIHAHWWLPGGLVGALVSRLTRTPLVITTHGTDVEQLKRRRWAKPLARFAFGQARVITCGSNYLREQLLELGVADAARVRVIPMPVNPNFLAPAPRIEIRNSAPHRPTEFAISNFEFLILAVARLTRQKSIDTLLEGLAILRTRGIDAQLRIVGDGDQLAALQENTRALGLTACVEFLGMRPQSELPMLYAECDAFVLPSLREGMGLVLAEALLCGAPVIATASGGVTDIVCDGETGLLFAERDANALANALEKYARHPEYAARLAATGRARVIERFSPERVAGQFLQIYADLAR